MVKMLSNCPQALPSGTVWVEGVGLLHDFHQMGTPDRYHGTERPWEILETNRDVHMCAHTHPLCSHKAINQDSLCPIAGSEARLKWHHHLYKWQISFHFCGVSKVLHLSKGKTNLSMIYAFAERDPVGDSMYKIWKDPRVLAVIMTSPHLTHLSKIDFLLIIKLTFSSFCIKSKIYKVKSVLLYLELYMFQCVNGCIRVHNLGFSSIDASLIIVSCHSFASIWHSYCKTELYFSLQNIQFLRR